MFAKKCQQLLLAILTLLMISPSGAWAKSDNYRKAEALINQSSYILEDFCRDPNYQGLHNNLKNAKAILILPQSLRGGFIVGGAGGTGVLIAKNSDNSWTSPAFYTMGSVSVGLQIGADASQVVLLVMTEKGKNSLLSSSFKLGADASVAAGPLGGGAKAVTADILSYSKAKGVFGGASVEGAIISVRDSLNTAYYGKTISPVDILIRKNVNNPESMPLRKTAQRLAQGK